MPVHQPRVLVSCAAAAVWFFFSGCDVPRDPEGTSIRVRGGTLRAGITEHLPWTILENEEPSGIEVELLKQFARRLEADIDWRPGSESHLIESLRKGELDVVIGGIKDSNPWSADVGMTQPYVAMGDEKHVVVVRQGENRWLLELDTFLQQSQLEIDRLLQAHTRL